MPGGWFRFPLPYVTGAAIADRRLLSREDGRVTFKAKDYRQGGKRRKVKLSGVGFARRWMLHVLPPGFVCARYYGLLANADRTGRLAAAGDCWRLAGPTPRRRSLQARLGSRGSRRNEL